MAKKNIKNVNEKNIKDAILDEEKKEEKIIQEETKAFTEEECEQILNEKIETDIPLIDVVEFEKDVNIEDVKVDEPKVAKQDKNKISFEKMFGYFWNGQI